MNIQNIVWPKVGLCTEEKMYFRKNEKVHYVNEKELELDKGGMLSFDTYFNGLSIAKWKKYTKIGNVSLRLKVKGKIRIRLIAKDKIHKDIFTTILSEIRINAPEVEEIILPYPDHIKGILSFELCALSNHSVFCGGYYDAQVEKDDLHRAKIGIVICTFKRESFIEKNLETLNSSIFKNQDSPLNGHMEVFISDNGQTLDIERLQSEMIHIVKNRNTGGAGGFTRGLIEILNRNSEAGITHALLMDDDIAIEPESLIRTYRILTLLKDEYADAFIGGAMLRNDKQNIQVESGASWNAGRLISLKSGLNMNKCKNCLHNEVEEYREFNAWWYCCLPMSVVSYENLPMPIFIRGDDVEYGLRNMKHLILMNGICVWHEPFENKYSSFLSYYILRNQLIDNALHFPQYSKKNLKKDLLGSVLREIMYYRYKNVELLIRGVEDFLKGIDWLIETDGEALHKEVMSAGYKSVPVESLDMPFLYEIYNDSRTEKDFGLKRVLRLITGNGYLLPTNRDNIVAMASVRPYNAYRAKRIMYFDVTTQKAFITEKNTREVLYCIRRLIKAFRMIDKRYEKVRKEYRQRSCEVQNIDFWKKYLQI